MELSAAGTIPDFHNQDDDGGNVVLTCHLCQQQSFLNAQSYRPQHIGYEGGRPVLHLGAISGLSASCPALDGSLMRGPDIVVWHGSIKRTSVPERGPTNIGLKGWCGRIIQPAGISSALNFPNMLLDVGRANGCIYNCLGTQHRPACTSSLDVVELDVVGVIPDTDFCGHSMLVMMMMLASYCLPCPV